MALSQPYSTAIDMNLFNLELGINIALFCMDSHHIFASFGYSQLGWNPLLWMSVINRDFTRK